jgi:tetratricopeptide (TPR) repeat protein
VDASLGRVATAQCFLGHAETAIAQLRDVHAQLTAELGADARRTQAAFTRLLNVLYYDGRYSERAELVRDEAARQREYGARSAVVAGTLTRLGTYRLLAGDAAGAAEALREAMATYEQAGKKRTASHERIKVYLAEACLQLGQQAEAEALARGGLDAMRARFDARDLRVGDAQRVLGRVLLRQGGAAQAEPLLRESVAVLSDPQFVPLRAWYWFDAQQAWAECLMAQQRFDEAETLLRELMDAQQKFFGAWPARAAATESLLGACLAHVPRLQDVAPALSPSLDGLPEHQSSMPNLP